MMRSLAPGGTGQGGRGQAPMLFPEHHLSHAASAFYPSPFEEAAILTLDGVGEWATSTIGHGQGKEISILRELQFPHSLGLLYSAFTYYCGFKVEQRRIQAHGPGPLRQSRGRPGEALAGADFGGAGGPEGRRLAPAQHGLFRLRHRAEDVLRRQVDLALRGAAPAPGERPGPAAYGYGPGHPAGHRGDRPAPGGHRQRSSPAPTTW